MRSENEIDTTGAQTHTNSQQQQQNCYVGSGESTVWCEHYQRTNENKMEMAFSRSNGML